MQQLGFRLAERLGHSRVHAIDQRGDFPFGAVMSHAQEHDTAAAQGIAQPGDRALVIFGAGHAAILRELISGASRLELVEANDYLP